MVDAKTLMEQAPMTADRYLAKVVKSIDERFGEGYAKANPTLVAAMLQACTADFQTIMFSDSLDRLAEAVHAGLSNLG